MFPKACQIRSCYGFEGVDAYLRSFLICSIFSGSCSANRSFKVWTEGVRGAFWWEGLGSCYLSFGGVASQAIEGCGSGVEGWGGERRSQRRGSKTDSRRHCEGEGRIDCRRGRWKLLMKVCRSTKSPRAKVGRNSGPLRLRHTYRISDGLRSGSTPAATS